MIKIIQMDERYVMQIIVWNESLINTYANLNENANQVNKTQEKKLKKKNTQKNTKQLEIKMLKSILSKSIEIYIKMGKRKKLSDSVPWTIWTFGEIKRATLWNKSAPLELPFPKIHWESLD